eukprot:2904613-Amphidinium_carterae.1
MESGAFSSRSQKILEDVMEVSEAYPFMVAHGTDSCLEFSPAVIDELLSAASLLPQMKKDLLSPIRPIRSATDASLSGGNR